ncbi:DMSO reductase anchor subunit (DmsC) [mine drainage metagenome]|uniref:DMSO reductase anchor subunit (DmsC) n=1 Tax=mine drainage metagenome TaxID=410659 RepID=A0A1J5SES3_9ZZZZ
MRPAWSVLFLTTLIGCAQGLAVALALAVLGLFGGPGAARVAGGPGLLMVLALGLVALIASFLHLGRPERAWRAAAMWRTSWLSREVIVLPAFLGVAALCWLWLSRLHAWPAWLALALLAGCGTLWVCTAMIYAGVRFIREWATPLTLLNFVLMGLASGFALAAALFAALGLPAAELAGWALGWTLLAFLGRMAALLRAARLVSAGSLQTAIGVRSKRIVQISRGFTAGSFNLHEFFHGQPEAVVRGVQGGFVLLGFIVPLALLGAGLGASRPLPWFALAWLVQMAGLLAERWHFFAQVNHPQNRYYAAAH